MSDEKIVNERTDNESSEDEMPKRKGRKRKLTFFDNMAADADGDTTEDEDSDDDSDIEGFIDDSVANVTNDMPERRTLENEQNKAVLLNYLKQLSKTEIELIGLTFEYTQIQNLFE